jgi:hypothetical protein
MAETPTSEALTPQQARRSHSILSAIESGWRVWFALLGSLAAWIIHLLAFVSLSRLSTDREAVRWAMHAITAGTLAMVVAAAVLSARLAFSSDDAGSRDEPGRNRFIGLLGLAFAAANGALIILEELYLNVIRRSGVA